MSRAAMQQAIDAIEGSGCKADLMAAADALRAALAEQAQPVAWRYKPMVGSPWWSLSDDGYYVSCKRDNGYIVQPLYTTPPAPQPLTIERLRDALVASRIIDPGAVEDPDDYDDGVTLHRIEALFRRIT